MVDDFSAIEDYLITEITPGLRVWCHADGVAAQFGRLVFTFSPLSSVEERGTAQEALIRAGYPAATHLSIGEVLPGEVESWTAQGARVVCDCPISNTLVIAGFSDVRVHTEAVVSLPPELSQALTAAIYAQSQSPWPGRAAYERHIEQVYERFGQPAEMLPHAIARGRGDQ